MFELEAAARFDRNGDMGDAPQFFVVAFSRAEARDVRIEAVIKASSKHNAAALASHFAVTRSVGVRRGMGDSRAVLISYFLSSRRGDRLAQGLQDRLSPSQQVRIDGKRAEFASLD
jgi:hypothetical protein